jgi:hypothetical protein
MAPFKRKKKTRTNRRGENSRENSQENSRYQRPMIDAGLIRPMGF